MVFLCDEGPTLETLDYTIRIGSTQTFLYFRYKTVGPILGAVYMSPANRASPGNLLKENLILAMRRPPK